jgi:hypothetical protein
MKEIYYHSCHDNHHARYNYPFSGIAVHDVKVSSKPGAGSLKRNRLR